MLQFNIQLNICATKDMSFFSNQTEILQTLQEISEKEAKQRLPTVVFLCILIVLGLTGNLVVLFAFTFKYPPNNFRCYILCLVGIDMLACCISMPAEIIDNHHPYMFFSGTFCRVERFLGKVAMIGSACVLTLMAIERYRKVCHPFTNTKFPRTAGVYCTIALVLTIMFSWPKAVISGTQKIVFPGNVTGHDCSIDSTLLETVYPFVYTIVQLILFLVTFVTLVILYTLIISNLYKQSGHDMHSGTKRSERMLQKSRKVTKIMLAISAAFVISYFPHFVLITISTFKQANNIAEPSALVLGTFPLLYRSYFINNVVNPFIYYIGDQQFRDICSGCFKSIFKPKKINQSTSEERDMAVTEATEMINGTPALNHRVVVII